MANIIDAAEYTPNEIYLMAQSDKAEGAAVGASFGGLGVLNQPHQQLANRTSWLYGEVNNLKTQVTAIQNRLVTQSLFHTFTSSSSVAISVNSGLVSIATGSLLLPTVTYTGRVMVLAFVRLLYIAPPVAGVTTSLGTITSQLTDQNLGNSAYSDTVGTLVTTGSEGAGGQANEFGIFPSSYNPGSTLRFSLFAGLTGAAFQYPYVTIQSSIVTLLAMPY